MILMGGWRSGEKQGDCRIVPKRFDNGGEEVGEGSRSVETELRQPDHVHGWIAEGHFETLDDADLLVLSTRLFGDSQDCKISFLWCEPLGRRWVIW